MVSENYEEIALLGNIYKILEILLKEKLQSKNCMEKIQVSTNTASNKVGQR